jgi:arylsulfatase A-like enzyme
MEQALIATAIALGSAATDAITATPSSPAELAATVVVSGLAAAGIALAFLHKPWISAGFLAAIQCGVGLRFGVLRDTPMRSAGGVVVGVSALVVGLAVAAVVRRWPRAVFAGSAALLATAAGSVVAHGLDAPPALVDASATAPDVLLITVDTTRRDRLHVYGGPAPTPNLDKLAENGVVFEDAVSTAPQTGPSHLSLLTGRLPARLGVVSNATPIGDRPELLARTLREHGWRTGGFVSGYPLHERFGFDQGFDNYDADFSSIGAARRSWPARLATIVGVGTARERRGDATVAAALDWVAPHQEPMFLWVHLYDPHGPYLAPEAWRAKLAPGAPTRRSSNDLPAFWPIRDLGDDAWWIANYDAEIAWTDHLIGELLAGLDARRGARPRWVTVVADHGESLGEHGIRFDHGDDLFDPAMRVPWLMAGPGLTPSRYQCQASTVDLTPTLLDAADVPDASRRDGQSLLPTLTHCEDRDAWMTTVAARTPNPPIANGLRRPGQKWVDVSGKTVRYDLTADPGELQPTPDTCDAINNFIQGFSTPLPPADDDATHDALERLGYMQP